MAVNMHISECIPPSHRIMTFYSSDFARVLSPMPLLGGPYQNELESLFGQVHYTFLYTFVWRIYGTVVRRCSHNDWIDSNIVWSQAMTERSSKEEHIRTQPIFTKYVESAESAHIVPESENLITGLQMTHLIVCL